MTLLNFQLTESKTIPLDGLARHVGDTPLLHSIRVEGEQEFEMRLVMDIGGGSTEFILGRKLEPVRRESLFMGCVTMSRQTTSA